MSVTTDAARPWVQLYRDGQPADIAPEYPNLLQMFAAAVERAPDQVAIRYFDGAMTLAELDAASDALAAALHDLDFAPGDRLVLFMQNNPAFVIGMIAAWKAGGIAVSANPMYKQRELGQLLRDSGASTLLCLDELHPVASDVLAAGDTAVRTVITFSALDGQTRDDARAFGQSGRRMVEGTYDLPDLLSAHAGRLPPLATPSSACTDGPVTPTSPAPADATPRTPSVPST